jgi:hypothetical protein
MLRNGRFVACPQKYTDKANLLLAELDKNYIFGDPVHARDEVFKIADRALGFDQSTTEKLVDSLVRRGKVRVCYPDLANVPYRIDDWFLERCESPRTSLSAPLSYKVRSSMTSYGRKGRRK